MAAGRRDDRRATFARIVRDVDADARPRGEAVEIFPWRVTGEFTDARGVVWRRGRGELSWARIRRLVLDHQVPVVHAYLAEVDDVAPDGRERLLAAIRPYLKGPPGREPGDRTGFSATEFTDDRRRSLLMIEETC